MSPIFLEMVDTIDRSRTFILMLCFWHDVKISHSTGKCLPINKNGVFLNAKAQSIFYWNKLIYDKISYFFRRKKNTNNSHFFFLNFQPLFEIHFIWKFLLFSQITIMNIKSNEYKPLVDFSYWNSCNLLHRRCDIKVLHKNTIAPISNQEH